MDLQEFKGSSAVNSYGCVVAAVQIVYWSSKLGYHILEAVVVLLAEPEVSWDRVACLVVHLGAHLP